MLTYYLVRKHKAKKKKKKEKEYKQRVAAEAWTEASGFLAAYEADKSEGSIHNKNKRKGIVSVPQPRTTLSSTQDAMRGMVAHYTSNQAIYQEWVKDMKFMEVDVGGSSCIL